MASINIYLNFNGNCEEAFNFYKKVFGSEFETLSKFSEMPNDPNFVIEEADKNKIMHVSMPINNGNVLMGSDTGGDWANNYKRGNNFSISINSNSKEEADKLFKELSKKGKILMPMNTTFWGSYFGMLIDQFEIQWMVSYAPNNKRQ